MAPSPLSPQQREQLRQIRAQLIAQAESEVEQANDLLASVELIDSILELQTPGDSYASHQTHQEANEA